MCDYRDGLEERRIPLGKDERPQYRDDRVASGYIIIKFQTAYNDDEPWKITFTHTIIFHRRYTVQNFYVIIMRAHAQ